MASPDFLTDFPAQLIGRIPLFTAEGCLPPGDFLPSQVELESRFVETGDRPQRASIYRGWNSHRRELVRAGIPEASRQLLDGSYTTAKKSPGDMTLPLRFRYPTTES